MKWYALSLIIAGIAVFLWSVRQNSAADLSNLPIVVISGIGGTAMVVGGVVWIAVLLFMK